ncbi:MULTISPECIES: O-antigen polymerase [unclassified Arthrobacter]|uniref:O-antigen polymerase n=1 Tax=unclassified Arthrobacter TaxID=235627 RepID=UPI0021031CA6|nr:MULTISPECIES: O-antigen polymerase [unclassified Arthrobacter]MCQ1947842.1 oligosaccharide repeat unit polymerase [Arthrobacter sp. zg-Y1116]MCQ1987781.1 oligosaccharide repeat unit polymerase [Arthrobacter sp. zg-Y844]MCQ1996254.1 oligosaccharide repeat unit polymerase [Arthrobacter sp. zg-Y1171]UWX82695.1 oligosaccharide repeat unit polymerase [Arthrobacter sp. zg-Y1171]
MTTLLPAGTEIEKRSSARSAAAMVAFLAFGVVLPLLVRGASAVFYTDTDFLIRYAVVLYAAVKLSLVLSQRAIRPVSGVFWIFVYTCMGVAPLAQLTTGRSTALAIQVDDQMLTGASLLTLLGCVCFDIAYHSRLRRPQADKPRMRVHRLRGIRVLRMFSIGALAAGLIYIVQVGGMAVFFLSRQEAGAALDAINPDSGQALRAIISGAGSVANLCALIFYIHVVRTREHALVILDVILMVALVLMNVVVNNPISNSRYWVLAVLFGLVLPLIRGRKALFNLAILGGTLASIFVFPLSDITRRAAGTQAPLQVDSVWTMIATKDYDQFTMLANTLGYTADHGLSWGMQALGPLLFWVPRVGWPDKPYDTGVEVGIWMNNSNLNLSAPLWAEAWINFGLLGVVLAFAGLGVLARRLDTAYRADVLGMGSVGYLGISIFAGYLFILMRGSLLQSMGRLMILAVSILILTTVANGRERSTP